MIYVLYETETGRAVSIGSTPIEYAREGYAVYELGAPYSDLSQYEWHTDTCTLEERGSAPLNTKLSVADVLRRLTMPRLLMVKQIKRNTLNAAPSDLTYATIDTLEYFLQSVAVNGADTEDPDYITGITLLAQVLDGAGQLPEGQEAFIAHMTAEVEHE